MAVQSLRMRQVGVRFSHGPLNVSRKNNHNLIHYLINVVYSTTRSVISSLIWIILGALGFLIYDSQSSPVNIVIGLPLILIGVGVFLNNLQTTILSVFSPTYNRGVCILCGERRFRDHKTIRKLLKI